MTGRERRARSPLPLVVTLFGAEGALYSAIAPLLPHYAHALGLSRPAAGVLVATYSAGLIVGSIIAARIVGGLGPRRTIVLGLVVIAASSAAFGLASSVTALDAFRASQGAGAGLVWAAGLAWLMSVAGPDGRGALIGSALAVAIVGTLVGPLIGTVAAVVSTRATFAVIAALSVALAVLAGRSRAPERSGEERHPALRSVLGARRILAGLWLVLLPAASISVVNTLVPLRLARLGAGGASVGAVFAAAAALAAAGSAVAGKATDRLGPVVLARVGLVAITPILAVVLVSDRSWIIGTFTVLFVAVASTACMVPAITLLTQASEAAGFSHGFGAMVVNVAFAFGETVGALVGARLAQTAGDELPMALLAALALGSACVAPTRAGANLARGVDRVFQPVRRPPDE